MRINAAKALAWLGDRRAIEPIAAVLSEAKAEADYGYNGTFKNAEYDDPAPRWREALIRALGLLEAHEQTNRIVHILNDERSVLEVRHAAAEALADLGNETALAALRKAALDHSFHSVRHVARDAFQVRGIEFPGSVRASVESRGRIRRGSPGAPRRPRCVTIGRWDDRQSRSSDWRTPFALGRCFHQGEQQHPQHHRYRRAG